MRKYNIPLTPDMLVTLVTCIYSFVCCYMTVLEGKKRVCDAAWETKPMVQSNVWILRFLIGFSLKGKGKYTISLKKQGQSHSPGHKYCVKGQKWETCVLFFGSFK